ncbi:hypothetical protein [Aurantibacter aestuarii]|uniref:Uncharacterized protein n=1 Tax=Aurantibacter aestuarii TaxID=1266046 RepID=A0A2T1N4U2_9FLAO|nr:hypothetical protein [Aurantibacter aestuarii]PSG86275.1 hypothetical protein C7H52_11300 [Aurantibacter aestuarii]
MKFLKLLKFFITVFFISFSTVLCAQSDVILKTDGEEMKGKVIKINDTTIEFIYENESLEYEVSIGDIKKITFASGRIQFFNKEEKHDVNLEEHHNKVAILPFGYIKDKETSNDLMTKKIQQETYTIFKKKAAVLKFQDPLTTNALLAKAGVNNNNIDGFTMGEICNILNVEYIVQGLVSIERTSVSNFSNSKTTSTNTKAKVDRNGNIIGDIWSNGKSKSSTSSSSSSIQNYSTNITMNVYTDKGENVFTKDHMSFWQTTDAYKITLNYLAKRTPLYKR